ncbi:MAG: hypothetical protein RLZZ628_2712 [Bacteroidota bacterium]
MTKRRAKRAQYKAFEKQLRALQRHRTRLWKEEYAYVELEKPLFVGYEKYFALRPDMKTRPDFPILEKLLALINHVLFSKNKNFTRRIPRKTKRAYSEKGLKAVSINHVIRDLDHATWGKLSRVEQSYFSRREITEKWGTDTRYVWNYPWMFVSKVRKKFVTHTCIPNATKMSESDQIENFIERHHLHPKIRKIMDGWVQYRDFRRKIALIYQLKERQIWREARQETPFLISKGV